MKKSLFVLLGLALFLGCNKKEIERLTKLNSELQEKVRTLEKDVRTHEKSAAKLNFLSAKLKGVKARLVTNYGNIELELFPEKAPIHCFNFIARAESGFYDNTQFHRVIPNFMIQGGDPNSKDKDPYNDGGGGPLVMIPHEFNNTKHVRGILSMARVSDVSAGAGSQFFIMHGDAPYLDNQYTAFGKVTQGLEVVDKIANVATNKQDPRLKDHPIKPVIIKTIEVYR